MHPPQHLRGFQRTRRHLPHRWMVEEEDGTGWCPGAERSAMPTVNLAGTLLESEDSREVLDECSIGSRQWRIRRIAAELSKVDVLCPRLINCS